MGTKTAVIDTNVIISAFSWGGKPLEAVLAAKDCGIIISDKQLEEIRRVVTYDRVSLSPERRTKLFSILLEFGQIVQIQNELDVIKEDPADNVILSTAIENNADFIITGDKHLLKLKQYGNVKIVTPGAFLALFG